MVVARRLQHRDTHHDTKAHTLRRRRWCGLESESSSTPVRQRGVQGGPPPTLPLASTAPVPTHAVQHDPPSARTRRVNMWLELGVLDRRRATFVRWRDAAHTRVDRTRCRDRAAVGAVGGCPLGCRALITRGARTTTRSDVAWMDTRVVCTIHFLGGARRVLAGEIVIVRMF